MADVTDSWMESVVNWVTGGGVDDARDLGNRSQNAIEDMREAGDAAREEDTDDPVTGNGIKSDASAQEAFTAKAYNPDMQGIYEHMREILQQFQMQHIEVATLDNVSEMNPNLVEMAEHLIEKHSDDISSNLGQDYFEDMKERLEEIKQDSDKFGLETREAAPESANLGMKFELDDGWF